MLPVFWGLCPRLHTDRPAVGEENIRFSLRLCEREEEEKMKTRGGVAVLAGNRRNE
jgi:hypothetical protein